MESVQGGKTSTEEAIEDFEAKREAAFHESPVPRYTTTTEP